MFLISIGEIEMMFDSYNFAALFSLIVIAFARAFRIFKAEDLEFNFVCLVKDYRIPLFPEKKNGIRVPVCLKHWYHKTSKRIRGRAANSNQHFDSEEVSSNLFLFRQTCTNVSIFCKGLLQQENISVTNHMTYKCIT